MELRRAALEETMEVIEDSIQEQQRHRQMVMLEMVQATRAADFDEVYVGTLALEALDDSIIDQTRKQMRVELHRDSVDTMIRYREQFADEGMQDMGR